MSKVRNRRLHVTVGIAAVAALTLAGCGSSTASSGSSSAAAPAASAAAPSAAASAPAASAVAASAAASSEACSIAGKKIQFVSMLREHPVIQIWAAGARDEAKKLGADYTDLMSQGDNPQDAITLMKQGIAQGSDGMVVVAFDPQWYPAIAEAQAAGIPVVVTHFPINEGDAPGVVSNIATDVAAYGAAAADAIGEKIGGKGTVAVTEGSFNNTEDLAASSFTEQMKAKYPDVKVLAPEVEGFDPPKAIAKASSILQANPDVVAAFSTTGAGSNTWAKAKADTKRDVVIVSMDYTRPNLELVKSGDVYGLVAQPLYEENQQAVDVLQDIICGKAVDYRYSPPAPIITQDNVDDYFTLLDKIGQ
jgi:ribose transport system substrate-binding protein